MMRIGRLRGTPPSDGRLIAALERVLVAVAGELAAALADETRPLSRLQGQAAVAGDIESLFASPQHVAGMLRDHDRGKLGAWMEAIEDGAGETRLRQILRGTPWEGIPIISRPDDRQHDAFLRSGHRRRHQPDALVTSRSAHDAFIAERQARVGSARKGWRDAGEDFGGSGGGWIQGGRKLGAGRVMRAGHRVRVEITNLVPYARYLLSPGRRSALIEQARMRALERLARTV